jgi:hypothetical protein
VDELPTTRPPETPAEGTPASGRRVRQLLWVRLLLTLVVLVAPLAYIIGQQSPNLLPSIVATFTPPTPTLTATATPVPLSTILRARPLRLPALAPASACPMTPERFIDTDIGDATGDGPVYLIDDEGTFFVPFAQGANPQVWPAQVAFFPITPGVQGVVLVRGRQLDGPNEVRFGKGDTPDTELLFDAPAQAHPGDLSNPWTEAIEIIRLREAGCYAIQIDSETASSVIVFRAKPQSV